MTSSPSTEPSCFTLQLLSPSSSVPQPLVLENLPITTTVGQLKERIRDSLSTKPPGNAQRLIHRGRLLARDTETMLELFGQDLLRSPDRQTLHLVLRDLSEGPPPSPLPPFVQQPGSHSQTPGHQHPRHSQPQIRIGIGGPPHPNIAFGYPQVAAPNGPFNGAQLPPGWAQQQVLQNQFQMVARLGLANQSQFPGHHSTGHYATQNPGGPGFAAPGRAGSPSQPEPTRSTVREAVGPDGQRWRFTVNEQHNTSTQNTTQTSTHGPGRTGTPFSSADAHIPPVSQPYPMFNTGQIEAGYDTQNALRAADVGSAMRVMTDAMRRNASSSPLNLAAHQGQQPIRPGVTTPLVPSRRGTPGFPPESPRGRVIQGPQGVYVRSDTPDPRTEDIPTWFHDIPALRLNTRRDMPDPRAEDSPHSQSGVPGPGSNLPPRGNPRPDTPDPRAEDSPPSLPTNPAPRPNTRHDNSDPRAEDFPSSLPSIPGARANPLPQANSRPDTPDPRVSSRPGSPDSRDEPPPLVDFIIRHRANQRSATPEVYILSSPTGPRAVLFNGNSGTYYSPQPRSLPSTGLSIPSVSYSITLGGAPHAQQGSLPQIVRRAPVAGGNAPNPHLNNPPPDQQPQPQPQPQHGLQLPGPMQPQLGHGMDNPQIGVFRLAQIWPHAWLILRLAGFIWWFTSPTSSWLRWITVVSIAIAMFIVNTGVMQPLAEQIWVPLRRHLENLIPPAADAEAQHQQRPAAVAAAGGAENTQDGGANVRNPAGPGDLNPSDTAARLVQQRRQNNANWLLDQVRRLERAGILFIASLAPGLAERHIAQAEAQASERQRQQEAEAAAAAAAAAAASSASEDTNETTNIASRENDESPSDDEPPAQEARPQSNSAAE